MTPGWRFGRWHLSLIHISEGRPSLPPCPPSLGESREYQGGAPCLLAGAYIVGWVLGFPSVFPESLFCKIIGAPGVALWIEGYVTSKAYTSGSQQGVDFVLPYRTPQPQDIK